MVELQFDGMCQGCRRAELDLERLDLYTLDGEIESRWKVVCAHEMVCKEWDERLGQEKLKNI